MLKINKEKKIVYALKKEKILNISTIELLNRNFFLSKESINLDKQISRYYIGKRNNFFILNLEICLFNLKKSVNLLVDIFYFKLNSQIFFFYGFETEFNLLIKNLIRVTTLNLKKNKYDIKKICFLKQIYFLGKWKNGSISNIFKIINHVKIENKRKLDLYNSVYKKKISFINYQLFISKKKYIKSKLAKDLREKKLKAFEKQKKYNIKFNKKKFFYDFDRPYKIRLKNFLKLFCKIKRKIKFKIFYLKLKKKKKLNIFSFLKKKLPINRMFFKKENYILLKNIPDGVIILSKNDILNLEAKYMNISSIAINDPDKNMYNVDYTISSNSSTRVLFLLYLRIFRSCIFIGRILKLNSLFNYHKNLDLIANEKKLNLNSKRIFKILYYYKKYI